MSAVKLRTPASQSRREEAGAIAEIADYFGFVEGDPVFNLNIIIKDPVHAKHARFRTALNPLSP